MSKRVPLLAILLLATPLLASAGDGAGDYPITPVPFTDVKVEDAFWSPRIETNRKVTIPYAFEQCEETKRIRNFAVAGGLEEGRHEGLYFNDSDLYKVIEGAAYALANHPDPELEAYVDGVIDKIAAAQEEDGYLYTARTALNPDRLPPGGKDRWSDIQWGHELYCVGHFYEAAVAYFQATGKRKILDVALKNAELILKVFGPDGRKDPPGHQEIEIGLARLFRITGERKYLDLAKFFLDQRGRPEGHGLYGEYAQDHIPVIDQDHAVGHSVRAAYLYTGMADLAALTGQPDYVKAISRIWRDVIDTKLYVTGGIGAAGGHEGFGGRYVLPNRTAYCETCAAIANAMWNQRMFLMTGEGRYMDVVERVIYNGFLSGISMEGNRFFYPNRLESHSGADRAAWFGCACCPSNVVRFVPSIPGYAFAHRGDEAYVNLYLSGETVLDLDTGKTTLRTDSNYPWDGKFRIAVTPEKYGAHFTVKLRIPGWARGRPVDGDLYHYLDGAAAPVELFVNNEKAPLVIEKGYARISRPWQAGDVIDLAFPMPVRRVIAHEKVLADRNRVALERGPVVFCAEGLDQETGTVLDLVLPDDAKLTTGFEKDLLGGVQVIRGEARRVARRLDGSVQVLDRPVAFRAIPYYAWAHRGHTPMTVWPARKPEAARPAPAPTLARRSGITVSSGGDVKALTDQLEPANSRDHENPYFHWWPKKGTTEWIELDFGGAHRVRGAKAYWFDDTGIGGCRTPASWRLLFKDGGAWKPVMNPSAYGVEADAFNTVTFDPVETTGLRFEVTLKPEWAAGLHELDVIVDGAAGRTPGPAGTKARAGDGASKTPRKNVKKKTTTNAKAKRRGNPIANASFEKVDKTVPVRWNIHRWGGEGKMGVAPRGRTGEHSVVISSETGGDLSFGQAVPVRPYATYRLSGWIKTENLKATTGRGALFNLHTMRGCATPAITGTKDWTRVEVVFETGDMDVILVNALYGGWGFATGKAWYDDVQLELMEVKAMKPEVILSTTEEGAPISKYIYGQFIEHLGRCIYGGIWAEMLEDRKFYYPVGHEKSPWKALGPEGSVTTSTKDPYVGKHTPEITARGVESPAGLVQTGLGLVEGKAYEGRIVLAGAKGAGPVRVALAWGPGEEDRDFVTIPSVSEEFRKTVFRLEAGRDTDDGRLEITGLGNGVIRLGTVSIMPADHVKGMRADTLALLRELDSPVYRWPGGNFVSGYDWKDGIGDPDRRPPRKNPAWTGVEHNDFGIHEFMDFCELVGTEPYVTVNTGEGTPQMAANEVEYFNGAADTPMGAWRAKNGREDPWNVVWWAVGNEMYGGWQIGHMPLSDYVKKHNHVVDVMRAKDPKIKCVAVGAVGRWTETTFKECSDHMELISEHFYVQELPGVMGHAALAPRAVKRICDAHRRYRETIPELKGKKIPVALDEWNYWYGPHVYGELGTRYFWKDGLGIARGLHEYFRNSDVVFMANYAQTVNVIGCIKTSKTRAAFATTGQVLKLYRQVFGEIPVAVKGAPEPLDVVAAWTRDRSALTVAVVNPTMEPLDLALTFEGAKLSGKGRAWRIRHDDPMVYNEPGKPDRVAIEDFEVEDFPVESEGGKLEVPSLSVTIYELR